MTRLTQLRYAKRLFPFCGRSDVTRRYSIQINLSRYLLLLPGNQNKISLGSQEKIYLSVVVKIVLSSFCLVYYLERFGVNAIYCTST